MNLLWDGYVVMIGADKEKALNVLSEKRDYTAVLELENFSKDDIKTVHSYSHEVFAYLNVGAIENWRGWYEDYKEIVLKSYDNWEGEYWADVTNDGWQKFICEDLAKELFEKGADGLFLDNFDVYYHYPKDDFYNALVAILEGLKNYNKKVIINGGDVFVSKFISSYSGKKSELIYGVNQESVFTMITDYDKEKFSYQKSSEVEYFTEYLKRTQKAGIKIFVLEYAKEKSLIEYAAKNNSENGWTYFVSPSLNLDGKF